LSDCACLDGMKLSDLHRGHENIQNDNHWVNSNFGIQHDNGVGGSAAHAPRARTFARRSR
jgi:hypothetical protein